MASLNLSNWMKTQMGLLTVAQGSWTDLTVDLVLRLYTDSIDADGVGTEVTGGSYGELAVAMTETSGQLSNDAQLDFTGMPTCTVVSGGLWTGETVGGSERLIYFGDALAPVGLTSGQTFTVAAGSLVVDL